MGVNTAMYVNDYDLSDLGLVVERVDGWLDALSVQERVTQLPGRVGAVILAPEAETTPRTISVVGVMRASSLSALRTNIHALQALLYRGTIEVRFGDEPTKMVLARTSSKVVVATPPQFLNPKSRVSFTLFCPDPLIYTKLGQTVGFSSVKQPCPLGTAVSAPILQLMGAATNPTVTYRNAAGESMQTMAFGALTLGASDYLEINCELSQIWKYASGVKTNAIAELSSGDFLALDPHDGDYANSVWPTLEVSAGSGLALYRKSWL